MTEVGRAYRGGGRQHTFARVSLPVQSMTKKWRAYALTLLSLLSSAAGFLAQVVLAKTFGVSSSVDAYFFALGAPVFVGGLISGAINFQLTPRIRATYASESEPGTNPSSVEQVHRLGWVLNGLAVLLGLLAIPLQLWVLPDGSTIRNEPHLIALMVASWAFAGALVQQGACASLLTARDRLLFAAVLPLIPPITSAAGLLLAGDRFGVAAFLAGQLAGALLGVAIAQSVVAAHRSSSTAKQPLKPLLLELLRSLPYATLAIASFSSYPLIDSILAPHAGARTMSQISFAQRIVIGMGTLLVAAPFAIFANRYSDLARTGSYADFKRFFGRSISVTVGLSILLALLMILEGPAIVGLLFQRGKFNASDVAVIGQAIAWMAPGMVLMLLSSLTYRAGFALGHGARAFARVGAFWMISYSAFSALGLSRGVLGLAAAYSLTWLLASLLALYTLRQCALEHFAAPLKE